MAAPARTAALFAAVAGLVLFATSGAGAATIVQPVGSPTVTANAPLTVVATGFPAGKPVFVEECDGVAPTAVNWTPTEDCDNGASPPPVIADAGGRAEFPASDPNRAFRPFQGESPQSLFNCMAAGHAAPNNHLPSFTDCKIRVSTNNTTATGDQVFFPIVLSGASVSLPAPTTSTTASPSTKPTTKSTKAVAHAAAVRPTPKRTGAGALTLAQAKARAAAEARARARAAAGSAPGSTRVVTVTAGDVHKASGSGLLGLSDRSLGIGYLLVVAGLLVAVAPTLFRRRPRRSKNPTLSYAPEESR